VVSRPNDALCYPKKEELLGFSKPGTHLEDGNLEVVKTRGSAPGAKWK
jgi:hypothetical protein